MANQNQKQFLESAGEMAKELVKFTTNMNFNEEMMLDMLEDSILPVEQFFANY